MEKEKINKAIALYYNLFENFFVLSKDSENYFELIRLINILKENSLDIPSQNALNNISNLLDKSSNVKLLQEFDDLFYNPLNKKVRTTASYYDEGVESGRKRVEMINFLAKTKIRRDEKNYFEYEDSIGFIFSFLSQLHNLIASGQVEYENTAHCIFEQVLNNFVDKFAKEIYEHNSALVYKELMIVLHSFIEFVRLYLDVSKPQVKTTKEKVKENISQAEMQRRARNKALKALGPKNAQEEACPIVSISEVEQGV